MVVIMMGNVKLYYNYLLVDCLLIKATLFINKIEYYLQLAILYEYAVHFCFWSSNIDLI